MRLYVYYRVPELVLPGVLNQVRAMQAQLIESHPGLRAEVLRRPELREGQVTLMETYAGAVDEAFVRTLDAAAAALPQPRHTEHFIALD